MGAAVNEFDAANMNNTQETCVILEKCRRRHRPRPRRSARRNHEDTAACGTDLSQADVEDVIYTMKANVGNPLVLEKGCEQLLRAVLDPDGRAEVARFGGVALVVQILDRHKGPGLPWLQLLEKMTGSNISVDAPGIAAVVQAMVQEPNQAELQATGCKILCNVAKHDPQCQEAVAKSGAAQAVLDAMRANSPDADVQELGCRALKELAAYNAESQEDIYMRGGIQVVLRAMESHMQLPNLQVMGCGVLRNLAACNSQQQQAVVSRGGVQVVLDAMKMHMDHSLMQWAGCWTLFCLCVHNAEMRSEVFAYGAARAALKALEAHRETRVQEAGCWLLKELAEHIASCKDRATFSAAIQAALKAVEKYPGNQAVEKAARAALQKLSAFDKEGWVKMACLGRCGRLGRTATMRTLEAIQE